MLLVVAVLLSVFILDDPWNWAVVALGGTLEAAESWLYVRWSKRRRAVVGVEALIGTRALVVSDCRPHGQVRIAGELWGARCPGGSVAGEAVVVRAIDGLTLLVERPLDISSGTE